jgi:hypothetical protein
MQNSIMTETSDSVIEAGEQENKTIKDQEK